MIGRGQVHVFEHGEDLHGAVVRFREEGLVERRRAPRHAGVAAGGPGRPHRRRCRRPRRRGLDALIDALRAELQRPPDEHSPEVQRHLLSTILLWIERWYDAARTERREADDAEVQLHRRFTRRLEEDFARHHDAAHYAARARRPGRGARRARWRTSPAARPRT